MELVGRAVEREGLLISGALARVAEGALCKYCRYVTIEKRFSCVY